MKKQLVATTLITACLSLHASVSPPSLASVINSRCDLEAIRQTEIETATVTNIYVSETNGAVLEVCVDVNGAILSLSEQGEMALLQRDPASDIDYYTSGPRDGKIKRIGSTSFDYYTSGSRDGKIKRIGSAVFNYYTSGIKAGKLKQIGDIRLDYYTSGFREGKLRRIGSASFDYDRDGRMDTSGSLTNANITIVDFIEMDDSN